MTYYYQAIAKEQLTQDPKPLRILYWASRWHNTGVWKLEPSRLEKISRVYGAAYEGENPLAVKVCEILAAEILPHMKEVWK